MYRASSSSAGPRYASRSAADLAAALDPSHCCRRVRGLRAASSRSTALALHDQLQMKRADEDDEIEKDDITSAIFDLSLDREHVYAERIRSLMDHNPAFALAQLRHDVNKLEVLSGVDIRG
jgi:hypothetical protein